MVFNWNFKNTCIVFDWWRVTSPLSLLWSCLIIIAIAASYEYFRYKTRCYDQYVIELEFKRMRESHRHENISDDALETDWLLAKGNVDIR